MEESVGNKWGIWRLVDIRLHSAVLERMYVAILIRRFRGCFILIVTARSIKKLTQLWLRETVS